MAGFSVVLTLLIGLNDSSWRSAIFTTIAFLVGATMSTISGWLGMKIAVEANSRVAVCAYNTAPTDYQSSFTTAFKAGAVMGFSLVPIAMVFLYLVISVFSKVWESTFTDHQSEEEIANAMEQTKEMFECVAGYGLGGSSVALFGRVGGGIYTKAADVGADMFKIERGLEEDAPNNPAVIADNVGDNVGDIAGMGADLFGSFAEGSCAAMVVSSLSPDLYNVWPAMLFPVTLAAFGLVVCIVTSFIATHIQPVKVKTDVEPVLKRQLIFSTIIMTPLVFLLCNMSFPDGKFYVTANTQDGTFDGQVHWYDVAACVTCGLWAGLIIGLITEYYTSNSYRPVREIAEVSETGAATNIIYGLALGYKSTIVPITCLAITIWVSFTLCGMYGVATAALGILSTLAIGLTIDAYGPICDNGGGIAEMSEMPGQVREKTDILDAAGNTTAAIGKGFAIGSAALVSLALFGAYVTTVRLPNVDIEDPFVFAGLLYGAMLPYWFSAMTMKSVGKAANAMIEEVRHQFDTLDLMNPNSGDKPDYARCVDISTKASLQEMIPPGVLVIATPLIVGYLFGHKCLAGLLAGSLVSGVQMAISASNTGGAWDNAKKYVEQGGLGPGKGKGTEVHKATVIGDTVGDPLKDTSGPALNILVKLSAIVSLVFGPSICRLNAETQECDNGFLIKLFNGDF
jgi:inorganic pyrophosphatase